MRRFIIFGLLGPVASYLSVCLQTGWTARWGDLPLAYAIAVVPFLICAVIDHWSKNARVWERLIVAGISGFITSAVAVPVAAAFFFRGNVGFAVFGFYAALPAAFCSLLSTATDSNGTADADSSISRAANTRLDIY